MTTIPVERKKIESWLTGLQCGVISQRHVFEELRALLSEQPQAGAGQVVPECFALVPIERSYDMRVAAILHYNTAKKEGKDHDDALDAAWRATLAKAHAPDGSQPPARHDQGDEVRRLREALEFACKSLAIVTSSDGSGHADIALIAMRMAGLHPDESEPLVAGWKAKAQWRADAALTQPPKGEEE